MGILIEIKVVFQIRNIDFLKKVGVFI